ncbi:nitrous oxide-stimulated promoter family protein [Endozoicomonas lisbonensis]|uniref:Nitrous oxide-stimulated promoter n=1 Tax=Endozoicomonas lisbonensis TaxID=3120522 RepID=A0ABV2SGK6_9GAMM
MRKQVERRALEPLEGELAKEFKTIVAMTHIYCRDHHSLKNHGSISGLCDECTRFRNFAEYRLSKCPYGQDKPTCKYCPVHCYKNDMKELARTIMIYSGPRMLLRHPILAIRHLLHDRKAVPDLPKKKRKKTTEETVITSEQ